MIWLFTLLLASITAIISAQAIYTHQLISKLTTLDSLAAEFLLNRRAAMELFDQTNRSLLQMHIAYLAASKTPVTMPIAETIRANSIIVCGLAKTKMTVLKSKEKLKALSLPGYIKVDFGNSSIDTRACDRLRADSNIPVGFRTETHLKNTAIKLILFPNNPMGSWCRIGALTMGPSKYQISFIKGEKCDLGIFNSRSSFNLLGIWRGGDPK